MSTTGRFIPATGSHQCPTQNTMDPLHITEFASERYFSKLRQLNEPPDNAASSSSESSGAAAPLPPPPTGHTFTLALGRQRSLDDDELPPLTLKPSEQKKRSLGHDLTTLRTQRRPTFTGSFGRLSSKIHIIHKVPSIVEHREEIRSQDPVVAPTYVYSLYGGLACVTDIEIVST